MIPTLPAVQADVDGNFFTPPGLAEYLGVTQNTLAAWRWQEKGPAYYKTGKLVRYAKADVRAWLAAHFHEGGD